MFKRLSIKILVSSAYHSQTDELSKRINQTMKIALRFLITKNSNLCWVDAILALQANLNNSVNADIEKSLNEIVYDFKIHELALFLTSEALVIEFDFVNLRERYRKKAENVTSFVNAKVKIYYDSRHTSLLLKSENKAFLRLNREYRLSERSNAKLFQSTHRFISRQTLH